jgi:hypothetical protein
MRDKNRGLRLIAMKARILGSLDHLLFSEEIRNYDKSYIKRSMELRLKIL